MIRLKRGKQMASGGKRLNSGRKKGQLSPKPKQKNRTIRLDDEAYKKFLSKGGIKWLRSLLTE